MATRKQTYYIVRYKISDLQEGLYSIKFANNVGVFQDNIIKVLPFCEGDTSESDRYKYTGSRLIKYLDNSGIMRVYPFNSNWEQVDTPTLIGTTNKFVASIYSAQTNKVVLGYTSERQLTLVTENVSDNALDKLADMFVSPKVYLHIGKNANDNPSDWLEVTLTGDGITRRKKNKFGKVTVTITLPERFNITK